MFLGITILSVGSVNTEWDFTTNRLSLDRVEFCRYLLVSLTLVHFFEGLVPCLRCSIDWRILGHSD